MKWISIRSATLVSLSMLSPLLSAAKEAETTSTRQFVQLDGCRFSIPLAAGQSIRLNASYETPRAANFNGRFLGPKTKRIGETWIQFQCIDASDEKELVEQSGIKRRGDAWVYGATPEPADALAPPIFLSLRGKNWSGGGVVLTPTAVDWSRKAKSFYFCMVHEPVALCGTAHTIQYVAYPKENVLPHVVKLLQGIEFIDESAAAASAPAASAAASAP